MDEKDSDDESNNSEKKEEKQDLQISINGKMSPIYSDELNIDNDDNNKEFDILNQKENIDENEIGDEKLENIKMNNIEKIICPQCYEIPKIKIDHQNYIIKSFCPNNHIIEDSLINFIKRSNEQLQSAENIKCIECKNKIKKLKNKENDMYKCNCGEYICVNCKEKHKGKKDEKMEHNLVEYNEKDFKCTCSETLEDYNFFCKKCNKNLCPICEAEHPREHDIKDYSDEILSDDEIKEKKKKFNEQKSNINKFLKKLYDLKDKLEIKIKQLHKTLQTYLDINNYIITKYNTSATNEQMIENINKINFQLPELIKIFKNSDQEKEQFGILLSIFQYQDKKDKNFKTNDFMYLNSRLSTMGDINKYRNTRLQDKIGAKVTTLCQIKNGIAVGDEIGKVHCYSLNQNKLNKYLIITDHIGNTIKYLYSLNNGNFISSIYNEFKIFQINDQKYNIIQTFKYNKEDNNNNILKENKDDKNNKNNNNEKNNINEGIADGKNNKNNPKQNNNNNNNEYYQILELLNGYLLYIEGNKLIILKPTFNNNYQEKPTKEIKMNTKIVSMTELNSNKFSVYCEDKCLYIFDSNNFKEKLKISELPLFKRIEGVNSDIIVALGGNNLFLISEAKRGLVDDGLENVYDVCAEYNKILILGKDHIAQYDVKINKGGKYLNKVGELRAIQKIKLLYLLKNLGDVNNEINNENANIACIYNEEKIKILKI